MFQLPTSELPLKGWKGGKRCTLIDKEKSLRHSFKNGKLYLTHSFLCFERHKSLTHAQMNIVLPLTDILKVTKAKPYSWVPGEGMSIAVSVVGQNKPYTFGAILNRDDVFENIVIHGINLNLPWAVEHKQNTDAGNENDGSSVDQPSGSRESLVEKDQFSPDSQNLFL